MNILFAFHWTFSQLCGIVGVTKEQEVTRMAKITIEELYRGDKYDIMSAVTAKALQLGIDERTEEGRTWIEMELVRQTVIAIEQMKKNGDCITEGELGDAVTVSVWREVLRAERVYNQLLPALNNFNWQLFKNKV